MFLAQTRIWIRLFCHYLFQVVRDFRGENALGPKKVQKSIQPRNTRNSRKWSPKKPPSRYLLFGFGFTISWLLPGGSSTSSTFQDFGREKVLTISASVYDSTNSQRVVGRM
jgi:hypothetical protein